MNINREQLNFEENINLKKSGKFNDKIFQIFNTDDNNRTLSTNEVKSIFDQIDTNQDGNLTNKEIEKAANKFNVSTEDLKNFITQLKDGAFKAKGKMSNFKDCTTLRKENGAQIETLHNGTIEITTPKKTLTLNNQTCIIYTKTTTNTDGSFVVENFKEFPLDNITSNKKVCYDKNGEILSEEITDVYGSSTARETRKNGIKTISNSYINDKGILYEREPYSYSLDESGNIYNETNGNKVSVNIKEFDNIFDDNGNLKKTTEFPIKNKISIKLQNGIEQKLELSIEDLKTINQNSPIFAELNDRQKVEFLLGHLTDNISKLNSECLNDLYSEINTIEIGYGTKVLSENSQGEYLQGTDTIRLHTIGTGFNEGTLIHELGHAIDDKVGAFDSDNKLSNLIEILKKTHNLKANNNSAYALTNPTEFFAEYYVYKYLASGKSSDNVFKNPEVIEDSNFKELIKICEEILAKTRNSGIKRKQDYVQIKDYSDKVLQDFILEYYDQLNNISPISTARELKIAIKNNPAIKEFYIQNIKKFTKQI